MKRVGTVVSVGVLLSVTSALPATGAEAGQARPVGDTRVLAKVPEPGQPAGIAVDGRRLLVTTAGVAQPVPEPQLFVYDLGTGRLARSHPILLDHSHTVAHHAVMALFGIAVDAARRAYVVDMNGRIIRIDPVSGAHEDYATFPAAVGGLTTMPFDIAFDDAGFAYVSDANVAAIWRVPRGGGEAQLWFQDPRLLGYQFGASGIRIDPLGRHVYFTVAVSQHPATPGAGLVYRLPLVEHPSAAGLQEVFRYPVRSLPLGIGFAASGKLYVALAGPNQISILRPRGSEAMEEERRFPSPEENARRDVPYEDPLGVAFDGCGSLLVTNSTALTPPQNPARHVVFDAFVGESGARLARPVIAGARAVPEPSRPACSSAEAKPTRRCLARRSPIGPRNIGRVRLGYTRSRMLRRVGVQPVRSTRHSYSWCVRRSSGRVSAVFGASGRSLLATSTARGHGNRRVRPGVPVGVLRRAYPRRRALGRSVWSGGPRSPRLVGARRGRVRFVGVADRRLLRRPRLLGRYLRRAGL